MGTAQASGRGQRDGPKLLAGAPAGLVTLLLIAALALAGCGLAPRGTAEVTLAELASDQEEFRGRTVVTEGVVQTFDDPRHYWIEDAAQNRVELRPMGMVETLVGARVRVEGLFTFADDEGRRIAIEGLEVLTPAP